MYDHILISLLITSILPSFFNLTIIEKLHRLLLLWKYTFTNLIWSGCKSCKTVQPRSPLFTSFMRSLFWSLFPRYVLCIFRRRIYLSSKMWSMRIRATIWFNAFQNKIEMGYFGIFKGKTSHNILL